MHAWYNSKNYIKQIIYHFLTYPGKNLFRLNVDNLSFFFFFSCEGSFDTLFFVPNWD